MIICWVLFCLRIVKFGAQTELPLELVFIGKKMLFPKESPDDSNKGLQLECPLLAKLCPNAGHSLPLVFTDL